MMMEPTRSQLLWCGQLQQITQNNKKTIIESLQVPIIQCYISQKANQSQQIQNTKSSNPIGLKKKPSSSLHTTLFCKTLKKNGPILAFSFIL